MMAQSASTDLIIKLPAVMTAESFTDEQEFEKLYAKVQEAVDKHVPDVTTRTGREAIASVAHKVARTKTALIKEGKKLTEDWREKTKKVNAACNTIEERLDALKVQVRKPLTDWEAAEEARIDGHKARLAELIGMAKVGYGHSSTEVREMIAKLEAVDLSAERWDEYHGQASVARVDAAEHLGRLLAAAEKQEAEAEELERLRAEKAERDRQEAERLAAEQAIQAKRDYAKALIQHCKQCALGMIDGKAYPYPILCRELEEKVRPGDECGDMAGDVEAARLEALDALRVAQKADQERREAENQAAAARQAEEARAQAERDAAERVAAAERAAQEAKDRAEREIAEAKARADREAEEERARIAAVKAAEEAEQRRRDADLAHRKQMNNAAAKAIAEATGISEKKAQEVVVAIVSGAVPHITLKY